MVTSGTTVGEVRPIGPEKCQGKRERTDRFSVADEK